MTVTGEGEVFLLAGGARHRVPGSVPPGRYQVEATFPGQAPVEVGSVTVGDTPVVLRCNANMGLCRPM